MVSVIVFMIVLGYDLFSLSSKSVKTNSTTITPSTNRYISIPSKINSTTNSTSIPPANAAPTDAPPANAAPTDAPPANAAPTDAPPANAAPTGAPPANVSGQKPLNEDDIIDILKSERLKKDNLITVFEYISKTSTLKKKLIANLNKCLGKKFQCNYSSIFNELRRIFNVDLKEFERDSFNKNFKFEKAQIEFIEYLITNNYKTDNINKDLVEAFLKLVKNRKGWNRALDALQYDRFIKNIDFTSSSKEDLKKIFLTYIYPEASVRINKKKFDQDQINILKFLNIGDDYVRSPSSTYTQTYIFYRMQKYFPKDIRQVTTTIDSSESLINYLIYLGYNLSKLNIGAYNKILRGAFENYNDLKTEPKVVSVNGIDDNEKLVADVNNIIDDLKVKYTVFLKTPEKFINVNNNEDLFYTYILLILHFFKVEIIINKPTKKNTKYLCNDECQFIIDKATKLYITDFINKFIYSHKYAVHKSMTSLNEALLNINEQIIDNMANHVEQLTSIIKDQNDRKYNDTSTHDISKVLMTQRTTNIKNRFKNIYKANNGIYSNIVNYIIFTLQPRYDKILKVHNLSKSIKNTSLTIDKLNKSLNKIKKERDTTYQLIVTKLKDNLSESIDKLNEALTNINEQIIDNMANHVEQLTSIIKDQNDRKYNDTSTHDISKVLMTQRTTNIKNRFKNIYKANNGIYSNIVNYIIFTLQPRYDKILKVHNLSKSIKNTSLTIDKLNKSLNKIKKERDTTYQLIVTKLKDNLSESIDKLNEALTNIKTQITNKTNPKQEGGYTIENSYIDYTITDSTQMRINNLIFYNIIKFIRYKYYIKKSNDMNIYSVIFKDYFITLILSIFLFILKMEKLSFGIIIDQLLSIGAFYKYKDHNYLLLPYYIAFV